MDSIVDIIAQKANLFHREGVPEQDILQAEKELRLHFAEEYKEYLVRYGVVSYENHELTGICPFPRLNVVCVTKEERQFNPFVPKCYYVIEQANMDGVVIWQASDGKVYQTYPGLNPVQIAESLSEYILVYV